MNLLYKMNEFGDVSMYLEIQNIKKIINQLCTISNSHVDTIHRLYTKHVSSIK